MLMAVVLITAVTVVAQQKTGVDSSSGFFSTGQQKKLKEKVEKLENLVLKSKVEVLGEVFKKHFDALIAAEKHHKVELVFLIDASSSVGSENFQSELEFVKKLLADFSVSYNDTRVALITFSSIGQVVREIDLMSHPNADLDKCSVLHHHAQYTGGGTYTLGAMREAQAIFSHSRPGSRKALFLVTDGFSNGGDPRDVAKALKSDGVIIFTFGVHSGNTAELYDMASTPGEEYSYILDSFSEFVALARRALHRDLSAGVYMPVTNSGLCQNVCSSLALCACGLRTGLYECLCPPGFYGLGTADQESPCLPCPNGTYHNGEVPGDVTRCTPCPDVNHITLGPAVGLQDCVCKRGFVANGTLCEMVKCPVLKPPKHGFFVRGTCGNVVNAGCGSRCKVGYTLIGSSVRLCQQDSKWSGKPPKCVVKRCPRLQPPHNGILACSPKIGNEEDFPVDAECRFSCHPGSYLVGSPLRTCLPLARWDGLPTTCKPIKCMAPPKVSNGVWHPEECMINRKLPFGQKCHLVCNNGFDREGPEVRECVKRGSWTHKKEISKCIDSMPPVVKCPENITVSTDPGVSYASVSWKEPIPEDNSNQTVLIWSDPVADFPMKLPIGQTIISYVATDSSYNQAVCEFTINVIDTEAPVVEDCESPPSFYLTVNLTTDNTSWTQSHFSDNSMVELYVNVSHELDELPLGTTEVTFTAFDNSGNSNSCIMNYTLIDDGCKELPPHTFANCSDNSCVLFCEKGYMFVSANTTIEVPYPCDTSALPECSDTEEPNHLVQEGIIALTPTAQNLCNDSDFLNQVKTSVRSSLTKVCDNTLSGCNVGVEAGCEDVIGNVEEEYNQVIGRRRRSVPHRNININFRFSGSIEDKNAQEKLAAMAKDTGFFINFPKKHVFKLRLKPSTIVCPPGTVYKRRRCVKCPPGTYWREKGDRFDCVACSFGTYQPLPSQLHCLPCPSNTSTRKLHAKHVHACKDICPAGTYGSSRGRHGRGRLGVKPCMSCPVGWYQPNIGTLSCLRCANNMTTYRRRTIHPEDCHLDPPPCQLSTCLNGGTCLHREGHITCKCLNGFLGPRCEYRKDECQSMPCLHGGTCSNTEKGHVCSCPAGFSGVNCEIDIDECASNPCQNGGECTDLIASIVCHCPPAFQGDLCEVNVNDCSADPCAEGSTCVDLVGNYSCECQPGFSGHYCELDPCLNLTLCQHNGTCYLGENSTQPPYWCECEPGYTGTHCEIEIDLCASCPCQHNATCHSQPLAEQPECVCTPGYHGQFCETFLPSNFTLFFPTPGTSNYVKLKGPYSSMQEVTVCLWMRTHDRFNYGTIFSYATSIHDNTLTLTDYNGFVLYVNGQRVVTDVTANDGIWHHICIEWTSLEGRWLIYKDGSLEDKGIGLSNNTHIPGGGVLVLGQEQDRIGGGFNAAESLVGYLTHVNLWNHNLGAEKVNLLATLCQAQEEGNVINWGQFRSGVQGKVQIEQSTVCQGCDNLSTLPFTSIEVSVSGNTANYTCDPGYSFKYFVTSEVTKLERKCLVHGDWEGKAPVCSKRSCGFPGYLPAGWIVGQSYLYQDTVEYHCQDGYRLVGNKNRTCLVNGTWSGEKPSCQRGECPDVYVPEHGMMWGNAEEYFKLEFECKSGYELNGSEVITCLSNKTWSHEPPQCLPITCKYINNETVAVLLAGPDIVEDGRYHVGNQIQIGCREGYRTDGEQDQYNTTCTVSGWSPPPNNFSCTLVVCPKVIITNGSVAVNSFTVGSKATVTCDKGFALDGPVDHVCTAAGEWSGTSSCVRVECPKVSTKHLTLPSSWYGKVATIQCPTGLRLMAGGLEVPGGEVRWQCAGDGKWRDLSGLLVNPHTLDCVSKSPKTCPRPEGPQFGYTVTNFKTTSSYYEGNKVQVQCRQGYTLQGADFTMCKRDGTWTNGTVCKAVDCGPPSTPPLTQLVLVSSTIYGSMAKLRCEDGYQAYGDTALRCQANKRWSRFRGRCVRE
ncbi:sushi, von Willebrand factor type A, EGF and pentraxin domain-containing protein 1-like isoform X2 [Homalodisca vitripennis]|uniref:sushi, von Willebrand factor type A, EGF and pentraxin domain-containing protein 1-like isoform X2 n=1 Tax=Homalodisca vitripennis TaxID=197043 RepID=UPI001EEA3B5B|nr:sushi, von Willebrand factor type A, EGF and pentraxin domain-containing protein 1-like isoform X2 [Homalodisca vitripennis]